MATTDETLVEDDPVDSGEEDVGEEPPAAATGTAQQLCVDSQLARTQSQQAQLQQLKAAAEAGEVLSKNAQKRLIKLQSKAERRGRAKAERKMRRQVRSARVDVAGSSVVGSSVVGPPQEMVEAIVHGEEHHAAAWAFWRRIGSPRTVLAPMVNQSELAFRMVARHYGAKLCFTPMLHSTLFASSEAYRLDNFDACSQERPLLTQFCGDDPATLLAAASLAQGECDAIDLNCGCPQAIARRGHYGAFLLEEPDLIVRIVAALAAPGALRVPVLVKMRLLPSLEQTVALAVRLQAAGASVITLHGRTREQKCSVECAWESIRAVKAALAIPVVANGGVERPEDIERCLAATGCDPVMLSEAALENPAIFGGHPTSRATQLDATRQYLRLARAHPPRTSSVIKAHLFKLLYLTLQLDAHKQFRERLGAALLLDEILAVGEEVCEAEEQQLQAAPEAMRQRCDTRAVSASRGTAVTGRTRAQWCPSKRTRSRHPRPLCRWSRSTRAASASLAQMGIRASEQDNRSEEPARPYTGCLR